MAQNCIMRLARPYTYYDFCKNFVMSSYTYQYTTYTKFLLYFSIIFPKQIIQVSGYPTMKTVKDNMLFNKRNTYFSYSIDCRHLLKRIQIWTNCLWASDPLSSFIATNSSDSNFDDTATLSTAAAALIEASSFPWNRNRGEPLTSIYNTQAILFALYKLFLWLIIQAEFRASQALEATVPMII